MYECNGLNRINFIAHQQNTTVKVVFNDLNEEIVLIRRLKKPTLSCKF
jgi:hypothetical protein